MTTMKKVDILKFQKWAEIWLEFQRRQNKIPGLVYSIFNSGGLITQNGLGYSDLEEKTPINPVKTKLQIGSLTKSMTAFAVALLVSDGLIDVDAPVNRYLKEYKNLEIKIQHLLSHTSGIAKDTKLDPSNSDFFPSKEDLKNELYSDDLFVYKQGKKVKFSNLSYAILGQLVEKVSGMEFDEFIQQRIFRKLKLVHSSFTPKGIRKAELAKGYGKIEIDKSLNDFREQYEISDAESYRPSLGLITSANDIAKFAEQWFLKNEAILQSKVKSLFLKPINVVENSSGEDYSMGLKIWKYKKNIFYGQESSFRGFSSCMIICPRHNIGSIVLTNSQNDMAKTMAEVLIEIYIKILNLSEVDNSLDIFEGIFTNKRTDIQIIPLNKSLCYYYLKSINPVGEIIKLTKEKTGFINDLGSISDSKGEAVSFDFAKKNTIRSLKIGSEIFYPKYWN